MTVLLALHAIPKNPDSYLEHYRDIHVPLAKALPGLRRFEMSKGQVMGLGADSNTLLVSILHFDSLDAVTSALTSAQGAAAIEDTKALTPNAQDIRLFVFETETM